MLRTKARFCIAFSVTGIFPPTSEIFPIPNWKIPVLRDHHFDRVKSGASSFKVRFLSNSHVNNSTIEYLEAESNQMLIRIERPAFDLEMAYRILIRCFVRQDSTDKDLSASSRMPLVPLKNHNIRELAQDNVDSSH